METTGASAIYDRVTEVAVVRIEGGAVRERFSALVDPGIPIPPFISRLTGIRDEMVRGQPPLSELIPRLESQLAGAVLVAHNVSFDHAFLKHAWSRAITLFTAIVMIALICTTRLYLGVHYPSDVAAGIVVGLAWAGFCMATLEASLVLARRRGAASVAEEAPAPMEGTAAVQHVAQVAAAKGASTPQAASPTG